MRFECCGRNPQSKNPVQRRGEWDQECLMRAAGKRQASGMRPRGLKPALVPNALRGAKAPLFHGDMYHGDMYICSDSKFLTPESASGKLEFGANHAHLRIHLQTMPPPFRSPRLRPTKSGMPEMPHGEAGAPTFGVRGFGEEFGFALAFTVCTWCLRLLRRPPWPRRLLAWRYELVRDPLPD